MGRALTLGHPRSMPKMRRASTLLLSVYAAQRIRIGGEVAWPGRGEISIQA